MVARMKPAEIKHKSVTHLHLTDPVRQFSRWYFSLKCFLITEDPVFGKLLEGERGDHLYHYEWSLAKLITYLVKDEDAQYTVGGCIRRHQETPGTAAMAGLSDAYQFDPVEHVLQLRMELHKPIQPGNTLRGYLSDMSRIRISLEDLGQPVGDKDLIACLINGLRVPEYQSERNHLVHNPQTSFDKACSLCRKTANQDTVVGGIAPSAAPATFYTGPGTSASFPLPPSRPSFKSPAEAPPAHAAVTPALVDALAKLTESVTMINKQLADQATINKSVEENLSRISTQLDRVSKGGAARSPAPGGPRPPPPVCTFCGKTGHSVSVCYAKRDADRAAAPREPATYAASTPDIKPVHYEAFMASHEVNAEVPSHPALPSLAESAELPSLVDIPGCGGDFSDPSTGVRYLGLCSGASIQILKSLVDRGRFIAEIYLCDKDSLARKMALDSLQQLATANPNNFSPYLREDISSGRIYELIPQDVTLLDSGEIIKLSGVNLVVASPDCQPFSSAGNQLGFKDERSSSFYHCLRIIQGIYDLTRQPLTFFVENVPGAGRFKSILKALGLPGRILWS
jgi:hypothetical protein